MDVLAQLGAVAGFDPGGAVADRYPFYRYDTVRTLRNTGTGHDLDAVAGFESVSGVARMLPGLDREIAVALVEVSEADCDAVHHHAVERRLIAFSMHGLAQHPADSLVQGYGFAVEGSHRLLDGMRCFDGG